MNIYAITRKGGQGPGYLLAKTEEDARKKYKRMYPECKIRSVEFENEFKSKKKKKIK